MFSKISFATFVEKDTTAIVEKDTIPLILDYKSLVYQHFHDETL